jgi:hypothetical protein
MSVVVVGERPLFRACMIKTMLNTTTRCKEWMNGTWWNHTKHTCCSMIHKIAQDQRSCNELVKIWEGVPWQVQTRHAVGVPARASLKHFKRSAPSCVFSGELYMHCFIPLNHCHCLVSIKIGAVFRFLVAPPEYAWRKKPEGKSIGTAQYHWLVDLPMSLSMFHGHVKSLVISSP